MQVLSYPTFEEQFVRMLRQCETKAEVAKKAPPPPPNTKNLDAVKSKVCVLRVYGSGIEWSPSPLSWWLALNDASQEEQCISMLCQSGK